MPRAASRQAEAELCIEACRTCHEVCLRTALDHCLELGGEHVEPKHFRLMLNCAEVCHAAANLLLSRSVFAAQLCALCADICEACADSCEQIGQMADCVQACRQAVQQCRHVSGGVMPMDA